MNKTEPASRTPMTLDDMMRELAAGLKDVIEETDSGDLERDPEGTFIELACRLVYRLRSTLTIVPTPPPTEHIRTARADAAARTLDIFTRWLLKNPGSSYETRVSVSGKFQIVVKTPEGTRLSFGEDVQDAYAQAAMTLKFEEAL